MVHILLHTLYSMLYALYCSLYSLIYTLYFIRHPILYSLFYTQYPMIYIFYTQCSLPYSIRQMSLLSITIRHTLNGLACVYSMIKTFLKIYTSKYMHTEMYMYCWRDLLCLKLHPTAHSQDRTFCSLFNIVPFLSRKIKTFFSFFFLSVIKEVMYLSSYVEIYVCYKCI